MTPQDHSGKQAPDNAPDDPVRSDSIDLSKLDELNLRLTDAKGRDLFGVVFTRSTDQPQLTFLVQGAQGIQTGVTVFDVKAPRRGAKRGL
jgi:hypothetical protein